MRTTATWSHLEPLDVDHTLILARYELHIGSDANLWLSTEAAYPLLRGSRTRQDGASWLRFQIPKT